MNRVGGRIGKPFHQRFDLTRIKRGDVGKAALGRELSCVAVHGTSRVCRKGGGAFFGTRRFAPLAAARFGEAHRDTDHPRELSIRRGWPGRATRRRWRWREGMARDAYGSLRSAFLESKVVELLVRYLAMGLRPSN